MKKTIFRSFITLEVVSETPISNGISLSEIAQQCENGDYSGISDWKITNEPIVGVEAAEKLKEMGSDPEFFRMDENGNDLDYDLDYDGIEGTFVSVWDDGTEIRTNATLDEETGHIDIEISEDDEYHGSLVREYFEDEDGEEYEVCPECHEYIMKTVMKDSIGSCIEECRVCSDSFCINN